MKELPVRRNTRLANYDYSNSGCYFITICVKNRYELLGKVIRDAVLGVPFVELSDIGNMVEQRIMGIDSQNGVKLETYAIMPNHIHLLVRLVGGTPRAASPTKATVPLLVNALKGLTSKEFGESMWQRSYHDHIIRNEEECKHIWQYIHDNPSKWEEDCYYKDEPEEKRV